MSTSGKEEFECPSCKGLVEETWHACPHCGVEFDAPEAEAKPAATSVALPAPTGVTSPAAHAVTAPARSAAPSAPPPAPTTHLTAATAEAPALPSVDTGELPFAPSGSGPKRQITVMDERAAPPTGPALNLKELISRDKAEDRIPAAPPSDVGRKSVTVSHEAPVHEPPVHETAIRDLAPPALQPAAPALEAPTTALAPTVVVVAPEPKETPARRLNEDLAAIERMINAAVAKALRENIAALGVPQTPALSQGASASSSISGRRRAAAVGAGLLLGGALGELVALNWDTWIRGLADSVVGPNQQIGVIFTAALAGAGAAVVVLSAGRAKHRTKRRHKQGSARAH